MMHVICTRQRLQVYVHMLATGLATSMLVTDVGGGLYWRVVGDRLFTLKVTNMGKNDINNGLTTNILKLAPS